jgi:putative addiction module component (TIGR02574 family)
MTHAQKRDLERRLADLEANPNLVLTWDEIKAQIQWDVAGAIPVAGNSHI